MDSLFRALVDSVDALRLLTTSKLIYIAGILAFLVIAFVFLQSLLKRGDRSKPRFSSYIHCAYTTFLKPHFDDIGSGQQSALERFYASQAAVYDETRQVLLRGRKDTLELLAAQMRFRFPHQDHNAPKPVWIDLGGGTGFNLEVMDTILGIDDFFQHIYLVDLSPSLCNVARQRVKRIGWQNVTIICEDARVFHPEVHASLVTMSYSLSMIPSFYSVVDSLENLLDPKGIIGICDFYVQSIVDISNESFIGGSLNRHVNWLGRMFWRAWFEGDRVNLDGGRRSYVEYRFGTILSLSERNYWLGGIPYYIFIGCARRVDEPLEKLDAAVTESPYLSPKEYLKERSAIAEEGGYIRSKAYDSAIVNLASNLPLPSAFYQNHKWRVHYNEFLNTHKQFHGRYLYAFNWEDPRVDRRLLNIQQDDVILSITSAGDNILDYLLEGPRRVHAVDLNPAQNALLELKVAAFVAGIGHADVWGLFGEGKHSTFHKVLSNKLSPHLSSQALQYWLKHGSVFTSRNGLYETGGSGIAIQLVRRLFRVFGLTSKVRTMCSVETLNEQREIWPFVRRVLLSWPLHYAVVGTKSWAWKAAGVPPAQRQMIQDDYAKGQGQRTTQVVCKEAIWEYLVNTFDPVVNNSLLSRDNYFYHLCLQGRYSKKCHPRYLGPRAHVKLSRTGSFDGLRIHTDEIIEVITRMAPSTLTIAVLMDSLDWFDPSTEAAKAQVVALHRVLKIGGRVLLRSAGLQPWYITVFQQNGFKCTCAGRRTSGTYIDRVNMYASTWLCIKADNKFPADDKAAEPENRSHQLENLTIGDAAVGIA